LLGAADGRKLFSKIHVKIQIVISYVFACNKNKALQLQRVPILSILGYNIGSLAARPVFKRLSSQFPKPKTKGRHLTTAPSDKGPATPLTMGVSRLCKLLLKAQKSSLQEEHTFINISRVIEFNIPVSRRGTCPNDCRVGLYMTRIRKNDGRSSVPL